MNAAPAALFDVDALRSVSQPVLGAPAQPEPLVVLGSAQPVEDLDAAALERDGLGVRRRRGGGGAVLLRPEDVWVELWLPAAQRGGQHDVRALAYQVGEWWAAALRTLGVETTMHRGGVQDAAEGAVACFAGVGPGELCVDGDKLLGLSQWRARQGTLVSSVVGVRSPQDLARYLALPRRAPHLERSVGLGELTAAVEVDDLVDAFATAVSHDVPTVRVEAGLFS